MSLLLDALKKAEKAKEEAQRRPSSGELSLAPDDDAPVDGTKHVITRDELPDHTQPMEIDSDDIREAPSPAAAMPDMAPPAAQRRPERTEPRMPQAASAQASESVVQERAAAKKVFEAKFKEPNPKLPFYIAMGALGSFALGTVIYFWYELRPPPPLVNLNPPTTGASAAAPGPESRPTASARPAAPATPAVAPAIPGLPAGAAPPTSAAQVATAPPAAASAPAATVTVQQLPSAAPASTAPAVPAKTPSGPSAPAEKPVAATPAATPSEARMEPVAKPAASARPSTGARAQGTTQVRRAPSRVQPQLEAAYSAFQEGNMEAARAGYAKVLRSEPRNRDALLGMAAVEVRSQNPQAADTLYRRLLQIDPRDPHAQAGLLALGSRTIDPVLAESKVKSLIRENPEEKFLFFALGNQFAQQGRWPEAQQSYFKAFAANPDNPDFAYNLAISLDHLRQSSQALEYYRRALALAEKHAATFDLSAARKRVAELAH